MYRTALYVVPGLINSQTFIGFLWAGTNWPAVGFRVGFLTFLCRRQLKRCFLGPFNDSNCLFDLTEWQEVSSVVGIYALQ